MDSGDSLRENKRSAMLPASEFCGCSSDIGSLVLLGLVWELDR
jgi:hypothetical protein